MVLKKVKWWYFVMMNQIYKRFCCLIFRIDTFLKIIYEKILHYGKNRFYHKASHLFHDAVDALRGLREGSYRKKDQDQRADPKGKTRE